MEIIHIVIIFVFILLLCYTSTYPEIEHFKITKNMKCIASHRGEKHSNPQTEKAFSDIHKMKQDSYCKQCSFSVAAGQTNACKPMHTKKKNGVPHHIQMKQISENEKKGKVMKNLINHSN